jgi:hypothetical protein
MANKALRQPKQVDDLSSDEEVRLAVLVREAAVRRDSAIQAAGELFELDPDYPGVQVRMREQMQDAMQNAPIHARSFGAPARLEYVLNRLDIRAKAFLALVSDIRTQNAFKVLVELFWRMAIEEFCGFPPEVWQPVSGQACTNLDMIDARMHEWILQGYKRLESFRKVQQESIGKPTACASTPAAEAPVGDGSAALSRGRAVGTHEDRLAQFMEEHPWATYADIKYSARVHTSEFQDWRRGKLKIDSVMAIRIENVLSGATSLEKKPHKPRPG